MKVVRSVFLSLVAIVAGIFIVVALLIEAPLKTVIFIAAMAIAFVMVVYGLSLLASYLYSRPVLAKKPITVDHIIKGDD